MMDVTGVGSKRNAALVPSVARSTRSMASADRLRVRDGAARRPRPARSRGAARGPRRAGPRRGRAAPRHPPAGTARTPSDARSAAPHRRASTGRTDPPRRPRAPTASNRDAQRVDAVTSRSTSKNLDASGEERVDRASSRSRTRRCVGSTVSADRSGREQQHEHVVERRILLARAAHASLVAIAQRRLVPVMAVGDRHAARSRPRPSARPPRRRARRPRGRPTADGGRRRRRRRRRPARPRVRSAERRSAAPAASSNRPTTGLVFTPVARSSL